MTGLQLRWSPRPEPLPAAAVVATGPAAVELGRMTAQAPSASRLSAAGGDGWLLVLGASDDLPWVDGARYLGWQDDLLVPTTLNCSPPTGLIRMSLPAASLQILLPDALLLADRPQRPFDPARLP